MSDGDSRCWGVIPAAGIGSRLAGSVPKQYLPLGSSTVLEHSLGALLACERIEAVVVALHPEDKQAAGMECFSRENVMQTAGGASRSESVLAGLRALGPVAASEDWVLVHDAARPCVRSSEISQLIGAVLGNGVGGILAEAIVDTVKLATEQGVVRQTLDRRNMWRAQTPQMFRFGQLQDALVAARELGETVSDEACAMELAGHSVQVVAGSARNFKITVAEDLQLAEFYVGNGETRS